MERYPLLVQGEAPRECCWSDSANSAMPSCSARRVSGKASTCAAKRSSVVVIDKLPFAAPDDPLLKARLEGIRRRGGNPFRDFQLPQAVIALKQGFGRLIRDREDFGVVAICDPRLRSRGYGPMFLGALPPARIVTEAAEATAFLRRRLAEAGIRAPEVAEA